MRGAEREVGASTEAGQGKCFVAVIPWPPGPEVNTKEGRKAPNGLGASSSSEEWVIQEDQKASHSQWEAKQSCSLIYRQSLGQATPGKLQGGWGEKRSKFYTCKALAGKGEGKPSQSRDSSQQFCHRWGRDTSLLQENTQRGDFGSCRAQAAERE